MGDFRGTASRSSVALADQVPRTETRLSALRGRRHFDVTLLGLIVLTITAFNLLWVSLDSGRLYWDFARHLGDSLIYKDAFSFSEPQRVLETYLVYPPLVYWITDGFYLLLGTDLWVAIVSNVVFLSILVFATYGIGRTLWSRRVGLLSALFVVTSPLFVTHFKQYMLDAPLSAMVALALYLLIKSDHFAVRSSSLLFGVASGLGVLVKWTFPLFLLPAAVSVVLAVARSVRERSLSRLTNIAAASVLAAAIAALWYAPNLTKFRPAVDYAASLSGSGKVLGRPPVGSESSALWYFWNLINNQLYLIPFLFFVAGIVYIVRKDTAASNNAPLVLSIVGSYLAFSFIEAKDFRYTMPMLPAVAVVATSWLDYLRPRLRTWLTGGLVAYGALAFLVISFGTSLLPKDITIPLKARSLTSDLFLNMPPESIRVTGIVIFAQRGFVVGKPSEENWGKEDLFKEMVVRSEHRTFWYSGGPETIWFNTWDTRYYEARYDATWVASPIEAQFLIIRGPAPAGVTNGFTLVSEHTLPYDGPVRLYERA